MKKRNVMTMALSLAMVGVIAVGGTLAYLTAKSGPVTNTFIGSVGIEMTLDEAKVDANGQALPAESRVQSNSYTDILPETDYDKDPTVHLTQVPAGGVDLYVKVTGVDTTAEDGYTADVTISSANWTKVGDFAGVDGLYKYNSVITETGDFVVFDGISFDYEVENGGDAPEIKDVVVKAYAIQTGVDGTDGLAAEALK